MPDLNTPSLNSSSPSARQASRGWILAGLMAMMMLAAMDTTIVSTVVPQMTRELHGLRLVSWVFSIYVLAQTVTIPVYGKLADIFGRKPVLFTGTIVFLLGSAACALAWNMHSLIVFRGLQGLGAGAVMATVNTLAGDLYKVEERAAVQGWLSSVWGVSAIAGPLLGGALAEYISWRWIFIVNIPVGALALLLIGIFLHERFEQRAHRIDYAGSVTVLIALSALIFAVMNGGNIWPWLSWPSLSLFLLAALALLALGRIEARASEPVLPGWLWRERVLTGGNLATLTMGVIMMASMVYLPTFLQLVHGMGAIGAGLVLSSISIGWPTASALSGKCYMRIGFRNTAALGAILVFAAALIFVLMPQPRNIAAMAGVHILLGAGFGLVSTPLLVAGQSVVPWARRGVATGSNMFARYLGQSLGAALFGALFNAAIQGRLRQAPAALAGFLPHDMDGLLQTLGTSHMHTPATTYLQDVVAQATSHLYAVSAIVALLMLAFVCWVPRRVRVLDEARL